MLKIYLAHQVSGLDFETVVSYFETTARELESFGFDVLAPMTAKGYLRTEREFRPHGYGNPVSSNHAIFERDQWMVRQADIVFVNLDGMTEPSIGCTMELAWASLLGKHTIVVMAPDNPHQHAFVLEAADIVFGVFEDAMDYLFLLINGDMRSDFDG